MLDSASSSEHSDFCAQAQAMHDGLRADLATIRAQGYTSHTSTRWASFERRLLQHLRAEEELLLPAFELAHHRDAARLRAEHHQIRELLATIESGMRAQLLNEPALRALDRLLALNSQFEERSLFPWAQRCLRPSTRGEFHERTRARAVTDGSASDQHLAA